MKQKLISLLIVMLAGCNDMRAADFQHSLRSPDGSLELRVCTAEDQLAYSLWRNGKVLIEKNLIGMTLEDGVWGRFPRVKKAKVRNEVTETIVSPNYRCSSFCVTYNVLSLTMRGDYGVEFRAYNEGVAYRFVTSRSSSYMVMNELSDVRFAADHAAYMAYSTSTGRGDAFAMAFQNVYTKSSLSQVKRDAIAFLPITVETEDGVKLTLLESDLESYPGMFVTGGRTSATSLKASFAAYPERLEAFPPRAMRRVTERGNYIARCEGARTFPWRIWAVTADDREMPVNNLVYALASPSRVEDTSWIGTGKVAWDWWNDWGLHGVDFKAGINTRTYKYYIDFAARNGLEFVVLDEGWYDPAKGDMLVVVPEVDLEELVAYGRSKGVGIMLWTVFNVLDNQLEAACRKYSEMGVKGFKVDFLDRDDQTAVEMVYRLAEATARHRLTLDLHGIYKPTGLNRTYPNIVNFEAVFGMEEMKWSTVEKDMPEYDVTFPFIRMMAGPVDYTPGAMRNATKRDFRPVYYNPMSQGTRCHQLAAYVVHDSPLTMLADSPTAYEREKECTEFIAAIPNKGIDETRVLQGRLGEYIITARRVGGDWYVGGMTDWNSRDLTVDFGFLGSGNYQVTLFCDGVNAEKQAADYRKEEFMVTSGVQKRIHLASGGGFVMRITDGH